MVRLQPSHEPPHRRPPLADSSLTVSQYLPIAIGTLVGFTFYGTYLIAYINPRLRRGIIFAPEKRLETACIASVMAPIGLFIFAWTARADVHWIGSAIGSAIFVAANLVTFQVSAEIPLRAVRPLTRLACARVTSSASSCTSSSPTTSTPLPSSQRTISSGAP